METPKPPPSERARTHAMIPPRYGDAILRDALRYWDTRRAGRIVPARHDLDPAEMADILGHAALIARPRPGTLRLRLVGGRITRLMGMELHGMPLRCLFDRRDRPRLTAEVEAAFAPPALVLATVSAAAERSAAPVTTQMAILPLSDARGELCQALCVLGEGACRVSGPPPCRWRIAQMTRVALSAGQPVTPETARAQAGPRLRVIQGGKR